MNRRVVVTGLGILAPNGHGLDNFVSSLREGKSGIRFIPDHAELKLGCQVGGIISDWEALRSRCFNEEESLAMNEAMTYSGVAALDCWKDAGFEKPDADSNHVNWDAGAIVGTGIAGIDTLATVIPRVDLGRGRRMGSAIVEQTMSSAVSAKLSGMFALGNQVTTNSSACTTGTEAIIMGYQRIGAGLAERMLCGGVESSSRYIWSSFDSMRVLNTGDNHRPEQASRPMSASAGGFVPGSGAGLLMLESLESAQKRGARIYAEILGASINCGGHRNGGSMTAPNPAGVRRCIESAVKEAGIAPSQIDTINGHLTATFADPYEIENWSSALELSADRFPLINATKSLIGHCLGAAGGVESVASVLQLHHGFVHGSLNCEDLHEKILPFEKSVVHKTVERPLSILAKASFGFGDVNGCLVYKKWDGR